MIKRRQEQRHETAGGAGGDHHVLGASSHAIGGTVPIRDGGAQLVGAQRGGVTQRGVDKRLLHPADNGGRGTRGGLADAQHQGIFVGLAEDLHHPEGVDVATLAGLCVHGYTEIRPSTADRAMSER